MLTTLRNIGNSRGLLIPAAFLASCKIEDQVDMQLKDGQIVIRPVRRPLREGWFRADAESGQEETAVEVEASDWQNLAHVDDNEWVW